MKRQLRFSPHASITKQEMAQALGACLLDPLAVRSGKERLFETDNYPKLFNDRPISEYLALFWLGRAAKERGRINKTRPYAKWVVMNRMHGELSGVFGSAASRERFIKACEGFTWDDKVLKPLMGAFDRLYRSAEAFYSENKRIDGEVYDHSLFYKRPKLHLQFHDFWSIGRNPHRKAFEKLAAKLEDGLRDVQERLEA